MFNFSNRPRKYYYNSGLFSYPYEQLYGIKHPDWVSNLHAFGKIAVVHDGANSHFKHKLKDKRKLALFVGYPPHHAGEVSQFLTLATNKLILSRTAIFLHKS
jgi:hypothetical protein